MTHLDAWQPLSLFLFDVFWMLWLVLWLATRRAFSSFVSAVSACLAVLMVGVNADDISSALWVNTRLSVGYGLQDGLNALLIAHEAAIAIQLMLGIACFCAIRGVLLLCHSLASRVFSSDRPTVRQAITEEVEGPP